MSRVQFCVAPCEANRGSLTLTSPETIWMNTQDDFGIDGLCLYIFVREDFLDQAWRVLCY